MLSLGGLASTRLWTELRACWQLKAPPHRGVAAFAGCLLAATAALGCITELEPDVGRVRAGLCQPEDSDPDRDVSFKDDIMPLFERPSAGCGCHVSSARRAIGIEQSGLDLSTYDATLSGGSNSRRDIVLPGDPCNSVLLQKVTAAPPFGVRMPPAGPPFWTPAERSLLSDWIAEGARDN